MFYSSGGTTMAKVEPIRKQEDIQKIEDLLFSMHTPRGDRMFCMFEIGIYMGLRIGDMIKMRVGDVRGKYEYTFIPEKTDSRRDRVNWRAKKLTVTIAPEMRNMVNNMYEGEPDEAFLFPSRKHDRNGNPQHISRHTAWKDMKDIKNMIGLEYSIGCHTLRKTFGYHIYQQRKDVAWLQNWFQHSSPAVTLIYIGIADDEKKFVTDHMPYKNRARLDYSARKKALANV
jgi:integrase